MKRPAGSARTETGKRARASGAITDITDDKTAQLGLVRRNAELESRVRELAARLESANKELESFTFNVAHDLKAPLRAITGFSAMLAEDYAAVLDDEGRRRLAVVTFNAEKLSALITDIVAISRIGMTEPRKARISMRAMALAMYHEVATAEEIAVIAFNLGDIPDCEGDTMMIRKAWGNLLSNAIKFTAGKSGRTIDVSAEASGQETKYIVRDNGVGFNPDYAAKLWRLFGRLHRDQAYDGTGAGLAIVRRVVESHGGRVGATSTEGAGSTFWFTVPTGGALDLIIPDQRPSIDGRRPSTEET